MTGHRKPTVLGVDPQNEFHLSKQVSAALQDDIPVYEGDQFWESNSFFPIHFG